MRRNKNEFQLYAELFEALEDSMVKVSELVEQKEEALRKAREQERIERTGKPSGGLKGSSQ